MFSLLLFKGSGWTWFVLSKEGDGNKLIDGSLNLTLKMHYSPVVTHCLGFKFWFWYKTAEGLCVCVSHLTPLCLRFPDYKLRNVLPGSLAGDRKSFSLNHCFSFSRSCSFTFRRRNSFMSSGDRYIKPSGVSANHLLPKPWCFISLVQAFSINLDTV